MKISKVLSFFKSKIFWLILIILLGLFLRLYKIDSRIADWHSWRQADTAAVARNFYKEGFNPFIPKYDDMTPPGTESVNPNRYRFVEFPVYQIFVYLTYLYSGGTDVTYARLVSVLFSLGSIVFIYLIVKRYWTTLEALVAALLFAILPFNVYFSRTTLPEPTLIFFSLGMFYFTDKWILEGKLKLFLLSVFFTAVAFLIKPMAIFYLIPLVFVAFKEGNFLRNLKQYIYWAVLAFLPLILWRLWMTNFPEGIPASSWLFNGNNIRFKPAFFRWIFVERLGKEILSVTGVVLLYIGFIRKILPKKEGILLHLFLVSNFLYLVVFATGNVQHDYYQALIVPALVMFVARGFVSLVAGFEGFAPRLFTIPTGLFLLSVCLLLTFFEVKGFYQINNNSIIKAGEYADKALPKQAKVIAPWSGDTSFLYQVNRPGFSVIITSIDDMVKRFGITHFVSVNYDNDTRHVMDKYQVIKETPEFVVVDVTRVKQK